MPKLKEKSCNVVYLTTDDNAVTITSLSDSEEEKLALAAQVRYLLASRHLVWKIILATVRSDPRRDTSANDVGNKCTSSGFGTIPTLDKGKQKRSDLTNP